MATTGIRISHYAPLDLGIGTSGALSDVPLANTLSKLLSAPGALGNCVTLAATGTGVTAVGTTSGRLSNGSAFTGITATTF